LTNSDVFSTPAAVAVAALNTRTATSNSLHRHSRRRRTDGKTAFMITCYHSARTVVTQAHRSSHDIVIAKSIYEIIRFVTGEYWYRSVWILFLKTIGGPLRVVPTIIIPSLRNTTGENRKRYLLRLLYEYYTTIIWYKTSYTNEVTRPSGSSRFLFFHDARPCGICAYWL